MLLVSGGAGGVGPLGGGARLAEVDHERRAFKGYPWHLNSLHHVVRPPSLPYGGGC